MSTCFKVQHISMFKISECTIFQISTHFNFQCISNFNIFHSFTYFKFQHISNFNILQSSTYFQLCLHLSKLNIFRNQTYFKNQHMIIIMSKNNIGQTLIINTCQTIQISFKKIQHISNVNTLQISKYQISTHSRIQHVFQHSAFFKFH